MKPALRVPVEALATGVQPLAREAAIYATRVHRRGPGDALVLFDPTTATEAAAIVEAVEPRVLVRVEAIRPASIVPKHETILLQAIAKGGSTDAIVRDATELGATRFVPVKAARSVPRPKAERAERWRRIAIEAARQCGRGDAPIVDEPRSLDDALALAKGTRLVLAPGGDRALRDVLGDATGAVTLLVGPEGGLDEDEIAAAVAAGFIRVSLGPLVLRTETVCAAVLGALLATR